MYYFSELNLRGNHAGTKARNDAETILNRFGAHPVNKRQFILQSREDESIYSNVKNRFELLPFFLKAELLKGKYVFIQYPMLAFDWTDRYFNILSKNNKIVLLVHDLQSLRRGDIEACKKEIQTLNIADTLILHNKFMKEKLISYGLTVNNILCLDLFDYLCKEETCQKRSNAIAFAGNLNKSEFLYEMFEKNKKVDFNIYGNSDERLRNYKNVRYHGSYLPDELPSVLNGKFGLVWDGNDINTCSGPLGEYTKINNPHKLSLYIASGIPVIVWKEAAIAEFVKNNKIGIIVDDIADLEKSLKINEDDYRRMKDNVMELRKKIIHGEYLLNILLSIEGREK